MFYADFVLSKKGPLARIWLAAHWDKKLTKTQIFETNIESSIEKILRPKVKLALRTSGHLMLGVVRIYSRKTKYLLADCNEAFVKIKMAFRPGMVDLPEDHREAAVNAVTLPEVFHDFDSAMPDLNDVDIEAQFTLNQSRADEITIREDYGNVPTLHTDDGFGMNFDASSEVIIGHSFEGNAFGEPHPFGDASNNLTTREAVGQAFHPPSIFDEEMNVIQNRVDRPSMSEVSGFVPGPTPMETDMPKDDDFHPVSGGGLFEAGLFEDAMMPEEHPIPDPVDIEHAIASTSKSPRNQRPDSIHAALNDDDDFDDDHFIPPSPGGMSSDGSRPPSPIHAAISGETATPVATAVVTAEEAFTMPNDIPEQIAMQAESQPTAEEDLNQNAEVVEQNEGHQNAEQTTLLQNDEESFALAPVDASALRGLPKTKRKRKLIVDEVKNISGEEMKAQLSDTSDIVITLDLAPPTKRLMHWKETGGVEKLFALPGKSIPSTALFKNYQRHLTSKAAPNDEGVDDREHVDGMRDNQDTLDVNTPQLAPVPNRRGRKRKQAVVEEEQVAPVADQISAQEVTKKTRMSPSQNVEIEPAQHLPTIPEETTSTEPNDLIAPDVNASFPPPPEVNTIAEIPPVPVPSWLPETNQLPEEEFQAPSVPPIPAPVPTPVVTAPEENSGAPPPYPNEDLSERFSEAGDMSRTEPVLGQAHVPSLICPPLSDSSVERSALDVSQQIPAPIPNKDMSNLFTNVGYDENDAELLNQDPDAIQNPFNMDDHEINPITPGINAGGGVTPWHDADYDNPVSVGPVIEERGVDETVEQFEERLLNKRAGHLYSTIKMRISTGVETSFNDLIYGNAKKQVAQKFYSLLVLKKHRVFELTQEEPYGNILLTKGPNFDDPKL